MVIAGPTASGKSQLALALAERLRDAGPKHQESVIINADSIQVYTGAPILSAQPKAQDQERIPHYLYAVRDPTQPCSAALWRDLALETLYTAQKAKRFAILVGGSGLYLRALTQGLSPIPAIPNTIRQEARDQFARLGAIKFHAALKKRDPIMAMRLAPKDRIRVLRAWEVLIATGRSQANWQKEANIGGIGAVPAILLIPSRAELYASCEARLVAMIDQGAITEVAALQARDLDPNLPIMKAVGVREFGLYLAGICGLEQALAAAQKTTRHYAKRQLTWLHHQATQDLLEIFRIETVLHDVNLTYMVQKIQKRLKEF